MKQNIYLIKQHDSNFYKIGVTKKDPMKRLKQLQTGNGMELLLVKIFESNFAYKVESALHQQFKNKLINLEWFLLDDYDLSEFDIACVKYEEQFKYLKDHNHFFKD